MTDALKPCPFCGGEAECIEETDWEIGCYNGQCATEPSVWTLSKERAIAAWNTRAPAPAVKVKALDWHKSYITPWNEDWHTVPTGYTVRCADENGWKWQGAGAHGYGFDVAAAKHQAQAHHDATILAALEPATPLDDPRVEALVEAAKEVKADCIARADKNGVVPIGRGAWDQLTAALIALEENK